MNASDDRVLRYTRVLSLCIVPFLLAGFVILYLFPQHTARLWAWPLRPTMTAMVLASAYLGGAYFFVRAALERRWHVLAPGMLAVTLFASLLGVATVLHWDKFSHSNPAFWIWSALYFAAPLLVLGGWLANRRYADNTSSAEDLLPRFMRAGIAAVGVLALVQGAAMFLSPSTFSDWWPWAITPLSCRTLAAVWCLGAASIGIGRWSTLRRMLEVELVMVGLILLAAVRAHDQLDSSKPFAWPMLIGFSALFFASIVLLSRHVRLHTTVKRPTPIN
ncbi:hypothetical protein EV138_0061 [Kribbella voronezhensis]|uniref:Uncharacterized protein n=1 Tax=Kribbella voronezhensis TaxID=2512212 RepID=A0A4R7T428_9ACTN|nr:hypothetical protein [Kribbella voronezhensis]TDU86552.1 hypothetical protein EV138_0061 [Kribbella voronezhensis]